MYICIDYALVTLVDLYVKSNIYCMWSDWLVVRSLYREFIAHKEISPIAMAPCLSTLFARYSQRMGFFIVQTATSTLGSLLVRSVKKTSYCLKQVLHRNVLAGNQSNSFLLTHGDRRFNIHVHMQSFPLRSE